MDDLDVFIIKYIYLKEVTGTRDIARKYFFNTVNLDERYIGDRVDAKEMTVKTRLQRLSRLGLVKITKKKNGDGRIRNVYTLNNIKIAKHKFPCGYCDGLYTKINGIWIVQQLTK